MASADIFVFPSQTDTAGNVVLEAQASGLPVLVSRVGGPRENVHLGDSGFACGSPICARRALDQPARRDRPVDGLAAGH
jgi:glycosyltransferase involved in cell wall biosynthesis